jgi:hypothetical protein
VADLRKLRQWRRPEKHRRPLFSSSPCQLTGAAQYRTVTVSEILARYYVRYRGPHGNAATASIPGRYRLPLSSSPHITIFVVPPPLCPSQL